MEIQFKNILKKAKAIQNNTDPISQTFEGAIFKESAWYLALTPIEVEAPEVINPPSFEFSTQDSIIDILFLGDTYKDGTEDLLHKMIQAMKLPVGTVKRIYFDENIDTKRELESSISENRPKIVVSLGAIVTNLLLDKKEKLSSVHGQFLPMEVTHWKYLMVPVFHPEFLLINPNMKRTAWNDLQKIMEFLHK